MYGSVPAEPWRGEASAPPARPAPLATRAARATTVVASAAVAVAAVVVVLLGTALIIGGGGGRLSALSAAASSSFDGDWSADGPDASLRALDGATATSAQQAWAGGPAD